MVQLHWFASLLMAWLIARFFLNNLVLCAGSQQKSLISTLPRKVAELLY